MEIKWLPAEGIVNKIVSSNLVAEHAVPFGAGRDMVVHCAMEIHRLASFLPDRYADYHPCHM
jgi:hypothetical protein